MWFNLENWDAASGPIYMGANSSWEVIWTVLAAAVCVWVIIAANRHEHEAYKKLKK